MKLRNQSCQLILGHYNRLQSLLALSCLVGTILRLLGIFVRLLGIFVRLLRIIISLLVIVRLPLFVRRMLSFD